MVRAGIFPFYPIVPDAAWALRVARAGARCLQLRVKDRTSAEISREIAITLETCAPLDCQIIVNDHWREAMAEGCDYVHLGQEDLATADIAALKYEDIRIGISTHDERELAIAAVAHAGLHCARPDLSDLKQGRWPRRAGPEKTGSMETAASAISRSSPSAASRWSAQPSSSKLAPTASPSSPTSPPPPTPKPASRRGSTGKPPSTTIDQCPGSVRSVATLIVRVGVSPPERTSPTRGR